MLRFDEFPFWETRPYLQVRKNVMLVLLGRLNIIIFGCFQKMGTYTPKKGWWKSWGKPYESMDDFFGVVQPCYKPWKFLPGFPAMDPRESVWLGCSTSAPSISFQVQNPGPGAVLSLHNAPHYWSRPTKCPWFKIPPILDGISQEFVGLPNSYLVRIIPRTST